MSDHPEILTQFFLDPEVIFSLHTMFINAPTKEFSHTQNFMVIRHGVKELLANKQCYTAVKYIVVIYNTEQYVVRYYKGLIKKKINLCCISVTIVYAWAKFQF